MTSTATPLDGATVVDALSLLQGIATPVALVLNANASAVDVGVVCNGRHAENIERALRGAAPHWEISHSELETTPPGLIRFESSLIRPQADWVPGRDIASFGERDPVSPLLESVQPLMPDERLSIRLLLRQMDDDRRRQAFRDITVSAIPINFIGLIVTLAGHGPRLPRFERRLQEQLAERLDATAFEVQATIALFGEDRERLASKARSLASVLAHSFDGGFGGLHLTNWRWRAGEPRWSVWNSSQPGLYLTAAEIASLWHPPSEHVRVPGVTWLKRTLRPLPRAVLRAQGLTLGIHRERGNDVPIRVPPADLLAGSIALVGKTGVGKSTTGVNLLRQWIAEIERRSAFIVDPHGPLADDLLAGGVPRSRESDVVLLDLADREYPFRLPLFDALPGVPQEDRVQSAFSIVRLLLKEVWSPTRMEDGVFALTATACSLEKATPMDLLRLLRDDAFRRHALQRGDLDAATREWWAEFEMLSEGAKRELAQPIRYRIRKFYRTPALRNVVSQTDGPDFTALADQGAIIVLATAGGAAQADADFLCELFIARAHLGLLPRLGRPGLNARPTILAIDESQRFTGGSLPILLAEGRKLSMTTLLLTQFLDAWGELSDSVLGNFGTLVAFRCGPNDSRRLRASIKPFTPDDLEDLDRFEAIVKIQVDNTTLPAIDIRTLPLDIVQDESAIARIRAQSRARYARPRREVEEELALPDRPSTRVWEGEDIDED